MRLTPFALVLLAAFLVPSAGRGADPASVKADENILFEARISSDNAGLLTFFRSRIPAENIRDSVADLIKKLGDDDFEVREKATASLVAYGGQAAPLLRLAARENPDGDYEVIRRAQAILKVLDRVAGPTVASAAARLLAHRKPDGACSVLLAYVPYVDDDNVAEEVRRALVVVGFRAGKPEQALTDTLTATDARVRSTGAYALVKGSTAEQRKPLKKLLKEADPLVRLRAGLAFFDHRDNDSIPALIGVLADLPAERLWAVEDALTLVAGEKSPAVALGSDRASREKCRDAWSTWWAKDGQRIDLPTLDFSTRLKNLTLIVDMNRGLNGRVYEIGSDGQIRWQLEGLNYPVDAEMVDDEHVLVAEYRRKRVAEMDLKGNVKWEKTVVGFTVGLQRLPDGNTLIATRTQLIEVDRTGKDVKTINHAGVLAGARKMPDGGYAVLTTSGTCVLLDRDGKEQKTFAVPTTTTVGGARFDITPAGRILVAQYSSNKVVEYDRDGSIVWQAQVQAPISVMRLPNGRTLVGSSVTQRVVELDRSGREVWEYKADGRVMAVRKR